MKNNKTIKKASSISKPKNKLGKALDNIVQKPFLLVVVCSLLMNLIIEMFSRHSVINGVMFIFKNPAAFIFGAGIIAITLIPSMFIKRRYALLFFTMILWLAMGVTNCIVLLFRITPFSIMDIILLDSVVSIFDNYLQFWQFTLVLSLILFAVAGVVCMFIFIPKVKVNYKTTVYHALYILICVSISMFTAVQSEAISDKFSNLGNAYRDYGFTYCFTASIFSRGVSKPDKYSQNGIHDIQTQVDGGEKQKYTDIENPNIVLLQLESFFDVNDMTNIKFSSNPVPEFTKLKENYAHGKLTVPSIGAGTANTEFEVLTGMRVADFGIGEYPYKTILQDAVCESICYNLRESNYSNHAIHNHYGTFYSRDIVFKNLGFDSFTSLEFMTDVPTTPQGWAKDEILINYIKEAIALTENRDFVFTVSVEGHGKYPSTSEVDGYTPTVRILDGIDDESRKNTVEYYVNMIAQMDTAIGDMIDYFSTYEEPVMLVMYGDHLPNLDLVESDIKSGNLLQTEYVIWTNYDIELPEENRDLTSHQLSAYIMQLCNKDDGVLTKLHQKYLVKPDEIQNYEEEIAMLEYDMLYGDYHVFGGEGGKPKPNENMRFGVRDIEVTGVSYQNDPDSDFISVSVTGTNFNDWSMVYVNSSPVRTIFKSSASLIIDAESILPGDTIFVAQVATSKKMLFKTDDFVVPYK